MRGSAGIATVPITTENKMKVYDIHYLIDGKVCYKRYIRATSEVDAEEEAMDLVKIEIKEEK